MNWQKYGIDILKLRGGKMPCPHCSETRRNKSDRCLSVNIERGLFNCHHCGWKGSVNEYQKKEFVKPVARLEKLSQKAIKWFEERGISNDTLLRFKITEASEFMPQAGKEMNCICFNYFREDKLVNIKFRDGNKGFKMVSGSELIFYNLDSIEGEKSCVIVEGEIDCLTLHECGIYSVVSVPNGASKGNQKLEYLDNCWQYFEGMDKVVLAVDDDEAGRSLRDELARRIGKEKCFTVDYPEGCKDANEVLLAHGKSAVVYVIEAAKPIPLEGIVPMEDIYPVVADWYEHGYPSGARCRIHGFDELITFVPGQLTTITGIPGHGKDEFLNDVMVGLAKFEKWRFGLCDFEEPPQITTTKLMEKFTRLAFDYRKDPVNRMNASQVEDAIGFVDQHFFFVNTEDTETSIDGILMLAEKMVRRFGINAFRLNPWNWVEHYRPEFMSETEYISQALTKIIRFSKRNDVHFFLVAHTTKMKKENGKYEIPTLYNINGSANFFNKTHNGFTVYRHIDSNLVEVHVQKVKQSWLGKIGYVDFRYNTFTRQYEQPY